jgi:hypothetical protein
MSIGFGTTFGVGSTDRIVNSSFSMPTSTFTFSAMVNRNGGGGGTFGRVWEVGTSGFHLFFNTAAVAWAVAITYDGVTKNWNVDTPAQYDTPGDFWFHVGITFDRNTTGQVPTMWVGGTKYTSLTPASNGSAGSFGSLCIGNRTSDNARNFDGKIMEFGVWNRILTDDEMIGLSKGVVPSKYNRGLVTYHPLIRLVRDRRADSTVTTTGTAVQTHGRVLV